MAKHIISASALKAFNERQELTDTQLCEIDQLTADQNANLDPTMRDQSVWDRCNARLGAIKGAMLLRPTIVALHKIRKHLVTRVTTYPLADATYNQIVELLEGILSAVVQARTSGVKVVESVEVEF